MIWLLLSCSDAPTGDSTPVDDTVPGDLIQLGVIECAQPELRETAGPMYKPELSEMWRRQSIEPEIPDPRGDGIGGIVGDLTGDGRYEIFLTNKLANFVFQLDADGVMVDLSDQVLPTRKRDGMFGAVGADHDGDGDLDILAYGTDFDQVLTNVGGRLVDETVGSPLEGVDMPSLSGACGDLDGDEDLDCIIGTETNARDAERSPPDPGWPSILMRNDGGSFTELTESMSDESYFSYTFVHTLLDLDGDNDLDMFTVNAFGYVMWGNRIQLNVTEPGGEIAFQDISEGHVLNQNMDGMGVGIGDINGDELPDLAVTDWGKLYLYESLGGADYVDVTASRGLTLVPEADDREVAWGVMLEDMDNDRDLDMPVAFGYSIRATEIGKDHVYEQPDGLFLQGDDGQFTEVSEAWGVHDNTGAGRGLWTVDLNDDGYLDLIKREINLPATLYLSRCGDNHWLRVRLAHPPPNTHAIGAKVRVTTAQGSQIRWITAGGTSLGVGHPAEAHFGLGDDDTIETIEVIWPDGEVTRHEDFPANQRIWVARDGVRSVVGMPD